MSLVLVLISAAIVMVGAEIQTAKQEGINTTVAFEERPRPRKERPETVSVLLPKNLKSTFPICLLLM